MRRLSIFLMLNFWVTVTFAQEKDSLKYKSVTMPEFPGGTEAIRNYIAQNLAYPQIPKLCIEGTVYLRFVVTKHRKVGKVEIQRGVDPLLDTEAIRLVKSFPAFKPGTKDGKNINVWYSVPIRFRLK